MEPDDSETSVTLTDGFTERPFDAFGGILRSVGVTDLVACRSEGSVTLRTACTTLVIGVSDQVEDLLPRDALVRRHRTQEAVQCPDP